MRAAARGRKPNVNYALATLIGEVRRERLGEVRRRSIFKKAFQRANGRSVIMNFDIPDPESIKGSYLTEDIAFFREGC
jgi:hypothetical protein